MNSRTALRIAALTGLLGVALGAFGAHALKHTLETNHTGEIWKTATMYHLIHAVMLFVLAGKTPFRIAPWLCFACGVLIFSGTLYVLAVTNLRWLGAITPLGGISLMAGWICLIVCPATAQKPG